MRSTQNRSTVGYSYLCMLCGLGPRLRTHFPLVTPSICRQAEHRPSVPLGASLRDLSWSSVYRHQEDIPSTASPDMVRCFHGPLKVKCNTLFRGANSSMTIGPSLSMESNVALSTSASDEAPCCLRMSLFHDPICLRRSGHNVESGQRRPQPLHPPGQLPQ